MTLASAECIGEVEPLGIRRVVLPRELSIDRIAAIRRQTPVELEAFVHGALCISYSGQCLASLGLGGRSANRGQCAQPCRLPYQLVCDGRPVTDRATGGRGFVYPMSPHDLAAHDRIDRLIAAGVSALKIEGRLKPAEYVAGVTRFYRAKIDAAGAGGQWSVAGGQLPVTSGQWPVAGGRCEAAGGAASASEPDLHPSSFILHPSGSNPQSLIPNPSTTDLEAAFSRGSCHGWLDGRDDRALVLGASSGKRGVYLGQVEKVRGERVAVRLAAPIQRGDGVVFEGDRSRSEEVGGRVYEVFREGRSIEGPVAEGLVELAFRHGTIEPDRLVSGQKVWKTDEPQLRRRLQKTYVAGRYGRRVPVDIVVEAGVGRPLVVSATAATGAAGRVASPEVLPEAVKHPLTVETLREQFGRLGKTPYALRRLEAKLDGRPMCPLSVLAAVRHELVAQLNAAASRPPERSMAEDSALASLRRMASGQGPVVSGQRSVVSGQLLVGSGIPACHNESAGKGGRQECSPQQSHLHVLCRRPEQIAVALRCGVSSVIADFPDLRDNRDAVRAARDAGVLILLASPRIHKPPAAAADIFERLADERPDGLLVRNLAGLGFCRRAGLPAVADFSLNTVNDLTFEWLCRQGACRVTAAYDLNVPRLLDLAAAVEPGRLEVVVDRHTPLFHAEYCLFCRALSRGRNRADCGQPCRQHTLRLRDRLGVEHPVSVDADCRTTVFHADAQSLADAVPDLLARGVRHYRIELLPEAGREASRMVEGYRELFGAR
jgi:putative protease